MRISDWSSDVCSSDLVSINVGAPPDEMAHISYVQDTIEGGTLLPDYADGRIIRSDRKNYLMHPPLYYSALGAFSRITDTDPFQGHVVLRILSACLVGAGFLFWLLAFPNFTLPLPPSVLGNLPTCPLPLFPSAAGRSNTST